MRAIGKYIAVKEFVEKISKTSGGLILSNKDKEDIRYRKAEVLVVGGDVKELKKGDNIYFDRHAGFNIEINDDSYLIIKEQDVVIVL